MNKDEIIDQIQKQVNEQVGLRVYEQVRKQVWEQVMSAPNLEYYFHLRKYLSSYVDSTVLIVNRKHTNPL